MDRRPWRMSILDHVLALDSWVTSDQHWEHPRIREYQHRPEDHFELMLFQWLARVQRNDVLLHLGDLVCFGKKENHVYWAVGLPGRKYILLGNHDKHPDSWYKAAGFTVLGRKPIHWTSPDGQVVVFSHRPVRDPEGWDINVHGHVHGSAYYADTVRISDRRNVCVEVTDYSPVRLGDVLSSKSRSPALREGSHSSGAFVFEED